jgi:tetratricopeptide (TPR) repeat protein
MEKSRFKLAGYTITTDPSFMDRQNAMTPDLREELEDIYFRLMAEDVDQDFVKKLLKLIEKHPRNPQLKNYLSTAYVVMGRQEKAKEVNRWILKEHPGYLFAILNQAAGYYMEGEYERMPEVMGEEMELKSLYPERDIFHLAEVTGYFKLSVLYFAATGNLGAAESRLKIMEELAPDHQDTLSAQEELMRFQMMKGHERWLEEEKKKIHVTHIPDELPPQTDKPPVFENAIIYRLYEHGLYIPPELLDEILALPRESLIADLERVLEDMLVRYRYFERKVEEEGWQEEKMGFALHAIMLLGELRAEESLPKVLEVLSREDEFLDFWYGDHISATLWEPLYYMGNRQLEVLKEFIQRPGGYTFIKTAIAEAVTQIVFHQPERKDEVTEWFAGIFDFFANSVPEDNVIDSDVIGLMICDAIDLKLDSLLPEIKKLYDLNYVSLDITGEYKGVERDISRHLSTRNKKDRKNIKERYHEITTTWSGYVEEEEEAVEDDVSSGAFDFPDDEIIPSWEPVRKPPKVGRNDPCPCGSGKKYKHCCLKKDRERDGI